MELTTSEPAAPLTSKMSEPALEALPFPQIDWLAVDRFPLAIEALGHQ